jgi:predicted DNA-binding transcriptional regulator YafY
MTDLAISRRTLTRDITDIKTTFGIGIDFCNTRKGFYIPDDEVHSAIAEQVLETFDILNSIGGETGIPDYILPEKRISTGTEHFVPIKKAIKESKLISFEYKKFYPEVSEVRNIEPYALKQSRGRWYLLGFEKGDDTSKAFGLDRILWVEILNRKFNKRNNIDWKKKYEHCFAMFTSNEPPQKVVLSFDNRDGNYIETMPIHHSQKLRREKDRTIVELFIHITLDFIMELMSRSWSLEVIEPESLRHQVRDIFMEAAKRNG